MKYFLYVLVLGLGVSIYGYINSKVSYKYEVDLMRTHLEIHPNTELDREVDKKKERIIKNIKVFKISIIVIVVLILGTLLYRQSRLGGK